jgi:hypothetical protein
LAGVRIQIEVQAWGEVQIAYQRCMAVGANLQAPFERLGLFIRRAAQRLLRARPHDWGPPTTRLPRSLTYVADRASVVVGSNLVYAAIQQLGGTVRPKTTKYLAIPVLPHLRRSGIWPRDLPKGSMKFVPKAAITIGSHSWTGPALVRKEGSGQSGGAKGKPRRKQPRGKVGEVMFALLRRVRIRGRDYLVWDDPAYAFLIVQLEAAYRNAIRGGGV